MQMNQNELNPSHHDLHEFELNFSVGRSEEHTTLLYMLFVILSDQYRTKITYLPYKVKLFFVSYKDNPFTVQKSNIYFVNEMQGLPKNHQATQYDGAGAVVVQGYQEKLQHLTEIFQGLHWARVFQVEK